MQNIEFSVGLDVTGLVPLKNRRAALSFWCYICFGEGSTWRNDNSVLFTMWLIRTARTLNSKENTTNDILQYTSTLVQIVQPLFKLQKKSCFFFLWPDRLFTELIFTSRINKLFLRMWHIEHNLRKNMIFL